MCDDTACEYGTLVGGECGLSTKYPSTEYVRTGECNRTIERHFTDTLQASFPNCGLNTEAELILARAGKFETYFIFNLTLSCTLVLCTRALSCTIVAYFLIS